MCGHLILLQSLWTRGILRDVEATLGRLDNVRSDLMLAVDTFRNLLSQIGSLAVEDGSTELESAVTSVRRITSDLWGVLVELGRGTDLARGADEPQPSDGTEQTRSSTGVVSDASGVEPATSVS